MRCESRVWSKAGLALAMLSAAACSDPRPEESLFRVAGRVVGSGTPVVGATVTVVSMTEQGTVAGVIGESEPTDATGAFVVEGAAPGQDSLLVEAAGGTTMESWSGLSVALPAGEVSLRAAVADVPAGGDVEDLAVTPVSTIAAAFAVQRLALGKEADYASAVARAHQLLGAHFGGIDPTRTMPQDPTDPALGGDALPDDALRYGIVLTAFAGIAAEIADTAQPSLDVGTINAVELGLWWADDLSSDPALFDGAGAAGRIVIGNCPLPEGASPDCDGATEDCAVPCQLDSQTPRATLGGKIREFAQSSTRDATGLTGDDVSGMVDAISDDDEPELFPPGGPVNPDTTPPQITWVSPQNGNDWRGDVTIEVTATDSQSEVIDLTVTMTADGATVAAPDDDDDALDRYYVAAHDTTVYADGTSIALTAKATDEYGNVAMATVTIDEVNNKPGGVLTGVVGLNQAAGVPVTAYRFAGGVAGAAVGETVSEPEGTYQMMIDEGVSGPLLVQAGDAGSYFEPALPEEVFFDVDESLSTVVPAYVDGALVNNVVITPVTHWARQYAQFLVGGGSTVAAAWADAVEALETHFDLVSIDSQPPAVLDSSVTNVSSKAKYALVNAALSQMALDWSPTGGDFGVGRTSLWFALAFGRDLADGCWDGREGAVPIELGGVALTSLSPRHDLASALVAYLLGPENPTALTNPADLLEMLDAMSEDGPGPGDADPAACADGDLFPDPGMGFDQVAPTIAWVGLTPMAGSLVRGMIKVTVMAEDNLPGPLSAWLMRGAVDLFDTDLDSDDAHATADIDTVPLGDGPLMVTAYAQDGAANVGMDTRSFTIDNTRPVINVTGVMPGVISPSAVTPIITVTEAHPGTTTITLDGAPFASGTTISADGDYELRVSSVDAAGNSADAVTVAFGVDTVAPVVSISSPVDMSYHNTDVTLTAMASDAHLTSFVVTAPAGLTDGDGTLGVISANVDIETLGDGPRDLTVTATDAAGRTTFKTVHITLDRVGPTLVVTAPSDGTYTAGGAAHDVDTGTIAVAGSATDALSPIDHFTVDVEGTVQTLTPLPGGGFATTVTLHAPAACPAPPDENVIQVHAFDAAGNMSLEVAPRVYFDNCDPSVGTATAQVWNEKTLQAKFITGTYQPCLYSSGGSKDSLSYNVNAATPPTSPNVWKYAMHFVGSACGLGAPTFVGGPPPVGWTLVADGNPLAWNLTASDNRGVASVTYHVVNPNGVAGAPATIGGAAAMLTMIPGTGSGQAPDLNKLDGVYEAYLTVTDLTGRTFSPPQPIRWQQYAMGGPVHVTVEAADHPPTGTYLVPSEHTFALNNLGALLTAAGNTVLVKKLTIRNDTTFAVNVVPTATATGQWFEVVRNSSPIEDVLADHNSGCTASQAYSPPTASGACFTPIPTTVDDRIPDAATTARPGFVKDIIAYEDAAPASCRGGECDSHEWTVSARAGATPELLEVYLVTSNFSFLVPTGKTWAEFTIPTRLFGTVSLYGAEQTRWGRNITDAELGNSIERHRHAES